MTGLRVRTGLMAALLALAIAVFALAPAAEAAICGIEPPAACGQVNAHPDDGVDGVDSDSPHGVCGHGHCHHGGSVAPMTTSLTTFAALDACDRQWRIDEAPLSRVPGGLDRPPRG